MSLPVNEIFETIQGEGSKAGSPSVFIRLQGCPVCCPWCDTKHTWEIEPQNEITADAMVDKVKDAPTYAVIEPKDIARYANGLSSRHVVITGGEPCLYNLHELTKQLMLVDKTVQVETSGTFAIEVYPSTFVTVSPKFNMKRPILRDQVLMASEIKMPVGKQDDIDNLKAFLDTVETDNWLRVHEPIIWLQPLSQSTKATELCLAAARENGWRVSLQMHKYIGVR